MRLSRNTLLVNLRFLDMALSRLKPVATDLTTLCTDGEYLAYDPMFILRRYKQEKEVPVRDYLHVVFHCVFRHMYIHSLMNQTVWDLACDIAVENTITELGLKSTCAARERAQQAVIRNLREKYKVITAERLYRCFLDADIPEDELLRMRELFKADDHSLWYLPPEEKMRLSAQLRLSAGEGEGEESADGSGSATAMEADWEMISQRMQQDIEMFSKQQGNAAGDLMQNLQSVNRERYDYSSFLKKFAVMGEVMKINDDEFDYYRFLNQEKHGITVEDYDFHNEIYISIKQCITVIDCSDWSRHAISVDDCFEVKEFSFKKYTRQVNHIVAYLDRVTVWDRVRKDDVTVMDMMGSFTLAQITEFIAAAQETNAVNVLAALMEYKNNNFADFDPMNEFTLEW